MSGKLPDYAVRLDALHQALVDDFRQIVGRLPLVGGESLIDAGCGDGFFTALLADRLPQGTAMGLDSSTPFLHAAGQRLAPHISAGRVRLVEGDVATLPFDDASLDAAWTAHSMQSYPDIPHALDEFRRVLRPGGLLAVLETDNIHSIMLSWPPHVELAVRLAEHQEIGNEDSYIGSYFPRFAPQLLEGAGFEGFSREYVLIRRQQPASDTLKNYVQLYLTNLLVNVGNRLTEETRNRLAELADPASKSFLPRLKNFFFGSLQVLMTARARSTR